MKINPLVLFPLIVGFMMAVQGALNAQLGIVYKHAIWGAFVNFAGGLVAVILFGLCFYFAGYLGSPNWEESRKLPLYWYLGGIIGAAMVTTVAFLVPRIGMTSIFAGLVVGQLIGVLFIDHFGLLRVDIRPVNVAQLIGVCLLLAGLVLVNMKSEVVERASNETNATSVQTTINSSSSDDQ